MVTGGAEIVPNKAKYLEDNHKAFFDLVETFALTDNVIQPGATIIIPSDSTIKNIKKRFKALNSKNKGWQQDWRMMENEVRAYVIKRVTIDSDFKGGSVTNFASHVLQVSSVRNSIIEIKSGKGLSVSGKAKLLDAVGRPRFKDDEPICSFWAMEKSDVISGDGDKMDALAMKGGLPQNVKKDDEMVSNIIKASWRDSMGTSIRLDIDCFAPVISGFLCCLQMSLKKATGNEKDRIEADLKELANNMCCHPIVTYVTTFCPGNPEKTKISDKSIKEWMGAPKYRDDYVAEFSKFMEPYVKDHGKIRGGMMKELEGCEGGILRGAAEDIYNSYKELIISTEKDTDLKMKCDYLCFKVSEEFKKAKSIGAAYRAAQSMMLSHPNQANVVACTEYLKQTKGSKMVSDSKEFAKKYMLVHKLHKQGYKSQSNVPEFLLKFIEMQKA